MHQRCPYSRENNKKTIWDSGIFAHRTFTEYRHDNNQNVTRILVRYIVFMMYIGLILTKYGMLIKPGYASEMICILQKESVTYPIRYFGILAHYQSPDSGNCHDMSISVTYLKQNRTNGKICSKYILYDKRLWYRLRIFPLFYYKLLVIIFLYRTLCHIDTLYMTRGCILHPYFIRYGSCQQNFKYASEMVRIL